MKKTFLLTCIALFHLANLFSQNYVRDNSTKETIPYARIVNAKGMVIGITDIDGVLPKLKINPKEYVTIEHLSYLPKKIKASKLHKDIYLKAKTYDLKECVVQGTRHDYIHLKTYYRSVQLNDSVMKYFEDGIVDFYISLKHKKVKRHFLNYREYENKTLTSKDRKRAYMMLDESTSLPCLEKKTLIEHFKKKKYHQKSNKIYKGDTPIATIKRDSLLGICSINYDDLAEDGETSCSIFGFTNKVVVCHETENYNLKKDYQSYIDLINKMMYRKMFYKYKKDKKWQRIEVSDELYVLSREYISKKEMKKLRKEKIDQVDYKALEKKLGLKTWIENTNSKIK